MKLRTAFGVCIALFLTLLIVSAQNAAAGYTASPVVVMSVLPEGDYGIGDEITVTVNVFEKGERVEADNITVIVGYYYSREVNATPTGTPGVYEVTFTLEENDTYEGQVNIYMTVVVGNVTSGDYISFYIDEGEDEPEVDVETGWTSSALLRPGETFTAEVTVTADGVKTDADDKEITLYGPEGTEKLNWTKIGTGKYSITYTVPDHITNYGIFNIHINVEVANGTGGNSISFTILDIQVWYEKGKVNKTTLVATFWVNDMDGKVVNGAKVEIEYDHDNDYYTGRIKLTGTTVNSPVRFVCGKVNLTEPLTVVPVSLILPV